MANHVSKRIHMTDERNGNGKSCVLMTHTKYMQVVQHANTHTLFTSNMLTITVWTNYIIYANVYHITYFKHTFSSI